MNLYSDPTMMELRQLIDNADPSLTEHHVAVDFDGEIIMDPEVHYPEVPLYKYKFCVQVRRKLNTDGIKELFITLIDGFNAQPRHLHQSKNIRIAA